MDYAIKMKKIYVNKNDSVALIIEKVIKSGEEEIILYIPRGSELASSRNNFKLLKREAQSAGKVVSIESVDDDVLELASSFSIKASNPFFGKKKSVADIIVKDVNPKVAEENQKIEASKFFGKKTVPAEGEEVSDLWVSGEPVVAEEVVKKSLLVKISKFFAVVALAAVLAWVAVYVLPRARIELVLEKINWDFTGSVIVRSTIDAPTFNNDAIELPGVIFKDTKNLIKSYPASGREKVQQKAKGTITVYNEYSSEAQAFVQNTRFVAPDGKIFKTEKSVTVPGAKIVNGKVSASSIDVPVIAEKAGEAYNIGPVTRFRIPGLQGSPKYEAFYGSSKASMARGFVGEQKVPTENDITKAKEDVRNALQGVLKTQVLISIPKDIKILDKALEFSVTKEDVNKEVDNSGAFSITTYGEIKIMGFKEADLLTALANKVAAESNVDLVLYNNSLKDSDAGYGEPTLDFVHGKMTLSLNFKSGWVRLFNIEDFKARVASKSKAEITSLVYGLPGFKSGSVSLWPIWVNYAPRDTKKISVDVGYTL